MVARGSCDQIPWAGRVREGGPHGLRSCWATRAVRGLAIPPLTPNGPATVLSDHQCPHRRLPVWPVVLGVAVGQGHRGRRAVGYRLAAERDAGRVKMSAAQSATFVSTDRQRQLLTEPVAARGLGVSACAAPRNAVAPRGIEALTTQELEGVVAQHWGVTDRGRGATPKPWRILPATASPGVIMACVSGPRRVSRMSISPTSLRTETSTPTCSRRSTRTWALGQPRP